MANFSITEGARALRTDAAWIPVLIVLFLGILGHWVYDALLASLATGKFDMGTPALWAIRGGVAVFAAVLAFTGIYQQVRNMSNPVRSFTAFTLGFAVDAVSGSAISAAVNSGPAPEPAASFFRLVLGA